MANELVLRNISKSYPGVKALKNVSIRFNAGEVHALIGENGAGKSTLIKTISGVIQPTEGEIEFWGEKLHGLTPLKAIQKGIAVVHQELIQFEDMTVADNISMKDSALKVGYVDQKRIGERTGELLKSFYAKIKPTDLIRDLSVANRQVVEIVKAINMDAKIVIMDEPTAAITVQEQENLFEIIKQLKSRGITILYISHRLEELAQICDRVSVLRDGEFMGTYNMADLSIKKMIGLMVGRELEDIYVSKRPCSKEVVLKVENYSGNGVSNVSFELHKGEILGFAGLVGAGRTELMRLIYGAEKRYAGMLYLHGKKTDIKDPGDAIRKGIGLIPEDRKHQGLFLDKAIVWNITVTNIKKFCHFIFRDVKLEAVEALDYKEKLKIKASDIQANPGSLSGGNQQKVVLAKTLSAVPEIIIFDEPTRGVDVGARNEIYRLMVELTEQGKSIIMVSSDMNELLGVSERMIVLHDGKITGELTKEEFDQNIILERASGFSN